MIKCDVAGDDWSSGQCSSSATHVEVSHKWKSNPSTLAKSVGPCGTRMLTTGSGTLWLMSLGTHETGLGPGHHCQALPAKSALARWRMVFSREGTRHTGDASFRLLARRGT